MQPFTFDGLRTDSDRGNRMLYVKWRYSSLGRFPNSLGDYTIEGMGSQVAHREERDEGERSA